MKDWAVEAAAEGAAMHLLEQACSRAPKSMYRTAVNMLVRQHACTCKMGYNVCLSYHMKIRQT